MNRTSIPQIFEEVEKFPSKQAKIEILRRYDNQILRGILELNFIPEYKMLLPEGFPPFKKDDKTPDGYSETNLFTEFRRMYIWLRPDPNISKAKREQLWIQMLEGIHWKEADLLNHVKDKKLSELYKSVTYDLVSEAFPGMLPPKPVEEAPKKKKGGAKQVPLAG